MQRPAPPSAEPPPLPRPHPPQVYYPVAPEVYRDLLWEDVDVADPVEYTFCRYTPVTTEVRGRQERRRWAAQERCCGAALRQCGCAIPSKRRLSSDA